MQQCFKDHEYHTWKINTHNKPISECESYWEEKEGRKTKITVVEILTPENVWQQFQEEAESIVAPGGKLIANPRERNKRINAAYAALWLHDHRFQWAGLAAFASKQVGCGLLHASNLMDAAQNQTSYEALQAQHMMPPDISAVTQGAGGGSAYVYEMLALGNTTLFLDVFPLHAFYKKRGLAELKKCLKYREKILNYNDKYKVLWPIGNHKLPFGTVRQEVLQAFEAIEAGRIAKSVELLAYHEQFNILQPSMYEDAIFKGLLSTNQISYATNFPSGIAQAVELTLASQCRRVSDGRTISFSESAKADLSNVEQRMEFVLRAAKQFDQLLASNRRPQIEQSLKEIGAGHGVR